MLVSHANLMPGVGGRRVVLRPSRSKWTLLFFTSAAFTAVSVLAIGDGNGWGWLGLSLFGLGMLVSPLMLAGKVKLVLTSEGFTLRNLVNAVTYRWSDIEGFYVAPAGVTTIVAWRYASSVDRDLLARGVNRAFGLPEAGLGDTFGMSATDLAELMNTWRSFHTSSTPTREFA
jgi:hypothetical protein